MMPITLWSSCVVVGSYWGRWTIKMGMQTITHLLAWNRVHPDLILQDRRATALFCPNIYCHLP